MTVKGPGTGRASKLRIRTKDHRWIEIPYGAGQDTNLRSINIWDGTQWKCPTWGRLLWDDFFTDPGLAADLDSFLVKLSTVDFTGYEDPAALNEHINNPNYRHAQPGSNQWTLDYANFQRLFYLAARSDPTYRIVPLQYPLPRRVPNVMLDYEEHGYGDIIDFYPAFTYNLQYYDDSQLNSSFSNYGAVDLGHDKIYQPYATQNIYVHSPGPKRRDPTIAYTDRRVYQVGCIDMKGIRERIKAIYPTQDVTFTGQKHHIDDQILNRVIVKFKISPWFEWYGEEGKITGNEFDPVQFNLRMDANINTFGLNITDPIFNQSPLTINIPSDVEPAGVPIWSITGSQLTHITVGTHLQSGQTGYGDVRYWNWYQVGALSDNQGAAFEYIHSFEMPGENSLAFYAEVVQPVQWDDRFSEINVIFVVKIDRICLQYADQNKDVPADLIRWDALP